MKPHLPKSILTALIGAAFACHITPVSAGVLTTGSFSYEVGGTSYTFSGTDAIVSNYNGSHAIGTSGTTFTVGDTSYHGAASTANGPFIADSSIAAGSGADTFWKNLTNRDNFSGAVYGQTLLMKGATTTQTLTNNGMGNMAIGGLITEATNGTGSYVLNGDNNNSNLTLVANEATGMNMYIGADTEIKVGGTGQLIVATNGTWTVADGKTLTLTAGTNGAVDFQSAITVQGDLSFNGGPVTLSGNSSLTVSNKLSLNGSSAVTVSEGAILNLSGTVDVCGDVVSGTESARLRASGNGFGHVEYSANISDFINGAGTVNKENASWSLNGHAATENDGTLSYSGDGGSTYYIFTAENVGDYSSAQHLVVDLEAGGEYSLGTSRVSDTIQTLTIKGGTTTTTYGGGQDAFFKGDISIEAGGELKLAGSGDNGHDALGYNNGHATKSITMKGVEGNKAKLTLAYTTSSTDNTTTLTTNLNLKGHTEISGLAINSYGGSITVEGTDNTISSVLQVREPLTINVGENSSLTLSGGITKNKHKQSTLTKSGTGQLNITGDLDLSAAGTTISGGDTTTISSATIRNVAIQNSTLSSASGQNLSGTISLTGVTLNGNINITGGTTTYTGGTLQFSGEGQRSITISQGATLAHDGFNYTASSADGATIQSGGATALEIHQGNVSISNATMTKTANGDKHIGIALNNVNLTLNNGDDNRLYVSGNKTQTINNLTVEGGNLSIESAASVNGSTTIAESAKVVLKNSGASLNSVTGGGRVESQANATIRTAEGFIGTLSATDGSTLTDAGSGSGFNVEAVAGDIILLNREAEVSLDFVSLGNGHSLTIGTETSHDITLNLTRLTVLEGGGVLNANLNLMGTETLNMSGTLTLGCSVELGDGGINLTGSLLNTLETAGYVELFTGVDTLTYNGTAYSGSIAASEIFSNAVLADTADTFYTVTYENDVVMLKSNLVPEPATATLALLALAGLAARRRRK